MISFLPFQMDFLVRAFKCKTERLNDETIGGDEGRRCEGRRDNRKGNRGENRVGRGRKINRGNMEENRRFGLTHLAAFSISRDTRSSPRLSQLKGKWKIQPLCLVWMLYEI